MDFPRFLPVVIEIVIDSDGCQTFICRNSNGVVVKVMHDIRELLPCFQDLCKTLTATVSSLEE